MPLNKDDVTLSSYDKPKLENSVFLCLTLATSKDLEEIKAVFPEYNGIGISTHETSIILDRLAIPYVRYVDDILFKDRVYLVSVPSLFEVSAMHCILVYMCKLKNKPLTVIDPYRNIKGIPYYKNLTKDVYYTNVIELLI